MDRGDRPLSLDQQELRAALSARRDGYWDLLAIASGAPDAVDQVVQDLSADRLDHAADSQHAVPSIVGEKVEALAAFDAGRLIDLAASWRSPAEIGEDPFWQAAWTSALRHLPATDLTRAAAGSGPRLAAEAALLTSASLATPCSWGSLVDECRRRFVGYDTIRSWARNPLSNSSIRAEQVESAPMLLLRVLRGRERLLEPDARIRLRARTQDLLDLDPFEATLLLEVVQVHDPDAVPLARTSLRRLLSGLRDARLVIPLAYYLAGSAWLVP